jgi:hypothetical protein
VPAGIDLKALARSTDSEIGKKCLKVTVIDKLWVENNEMSNLEKGVIGFGLVSLFGGSRE